MTYYFDFVDNRAVQREDSLYSNAVGHFADSEGFRDSSAASFSDYAFENLDTALVSFFDSYVNTYSGSRAEIREVFLQLSFGYFVYQIQIHDMFSCSFRSLRFKDS